MPMHGDVALFILRNVHFTLPYAMIMALYFFIIFMHVMKPQKGPCHCAKFRGQWTIYLIN